ncbi:hypothetical protein FG386_003214 [Cryptosporidium ryanae]|uniref:uncharacterized protein n=1 Tax=Cryptosporidium ryanae TaxID=515981 RepID=UPI00351A859F|nr:hypothetical protein FG386_003214 [Cryptosporidium ryanae]
MIKTAILAAVECRISDLSKLLKHVEVQKEWKLILNSIPETLHIDNYLYIVPKPEQYQDSNENECKDMNSKYFNNKAIFFDSFDSIIDWSLYRCYQIIKNTFDLKFALPFLASIIKYIGFDIYSEDQNNKTGIDFYSPQYYKYTLLLFSFHSILIQYSIMQTFNPAYNETINIVNFIFKKPSERLRCIMNSLKRSEYEIEGLLSEYFETYAAINRIRFFINKQKQVQLDPYINGKCEPFVNRNSIVNHLQTSPIYSDEIVDTSKPDIINFIELNIKIPFEELIINYLNSEIGNLPIGFFCKLSRAIIINSNPMKKHYKRIILCPLKILQIIILSIDGTNSPLLDSNALEIQHYIDEIYKYIPNNQLLIKQIKKPLIIRSLVSYSELSKKNVSKSMILCPFCKRPSINYLGSESNEKYINWLENVCISIEFHEKQQQIVDILQEFPLKFIRNMKLIELTKSLRSPELLECLLIRLIRKIPEIYTFGVIRDLISFYEIINTTTRLPNSAFGNLPDSITYLLKFVLYNTKINNAEDFITDIISSLSSSVNTIQFTSKIYEIFNDILDDYLELNIQYLDMLCIKLNIFVDGTLMNDKIGLKSYINSIRDSIYISETIRNLNDTFPCMSDLDSIFLPISSKDLNEINCIGKYNKSVFNEPRMIFSRNNDNEIISNLFISNPSLCLINIESAIHSKLDDLIFLLYKNSELVYFDIIVIKVRTLLLYNYEKYALKIIIENLKRCHFEGLYSISLCAIFNHHNNCKNKCSIELHAQFEQLEDQVIKRFPFKFLEMYITYKSSQPVIRSCNINTEKILTNVYKSFKSIYICCNSNVKSFYDLYMNSFFDIYKGTDKIDNIYFTTSNLADIHIYTSTDMIFSSCEKTVNIISSSNVNPIIKLQICASIIVIFSRKEFCEFKEVTELFITIYKILRSYIDLYNSVYSYYKSTNIKKIKEFLVEESRLPIYLLPYDSPEWGRRWKLFIMVSSFQDITPLIHSIDKFKNKYDKLPLFVSFELFKLIEKSIQRPNKGYVYPVLLIKHFNIMNKYPQQSMSVLKEYYQPQNSLKNIDNIFIRLLFIIINISGIGDDSLNPSFHKLDDIHAFKMILMAFKILPSAILDRFSLHTTKEQYIDAFKNLISSINIWDNYWYIRKVFSSFGKDLLAALSLCALENEFFVEKRFSIEKYKRLIVGNEKPISQILFDLLLNASFDFNGTLDFVIKLSSNRIYQTDIIYLLIKILKDKKYDNYDAKRLIESLNIVILNIKLSDHFEIYKNDTHDLEECFKLVKMFCLYGFLNWEIAELTELFSVIRSAGFDQQKLLYDAIIFKISNLDIHDYSEVFGLHCFIEKLFTRFIWITEESQTELCSLGLLLQICSNVLETIKDSKGQIISIVIFYFLKKFNITNDELFKTYFLIIIKNITNITNIKNNLNMNNETLVSLFNEIKGLMISLPLLKTNTNYFFIHDIMCELALLKMIAVPFEGIKTLDVTWQSEYGQNRVTTKYVETISDLTHYIFKKLFLNDNMFSYKLFLWFIFGTFLLSEIHSKDIFDDLFQRKMFNISIVSSSKKCVLKSATNIRIDEVLLSKNIYYYFYKRSLPEVTSLIIFILHGYSFMLAGTNAFSSVIIPLLELSNTDLNDNFISLGRYICNKLDISSYSNIDYSLIGILFNILVTFRSDILELLVLQLISLKAYKLAMKIILLDFRIMNDSISSHKYVLKVIMKYINRLCNSKNTLSNWIKKRQHFKIHPDICQLVINNKISIVNSFTSIL